MAKKRAFGCTLLLLVVIVHSGRSMYVGLSSIRRGGTEGTKRSIFFLVCGRLVSFRGGETGLSGRVTCVVDE